MGWGSAWLLRLALLAGVASDDEAATEAEMRQHFRALAEVLEQSPQAREQWVAARLLATEAKRLTPQTSSEAVRAAWARVDAATQRALELDPDDPLLWWDLASHCSASAQVCDPDEALERVRALAPSNAAVWVMPTAPAGEARPAGHAPVASADQRLERMAAASRYDTFLGERVRAYYAALEAVPMPAALRTERLGIGPAPTAVQARGVLALGMAMADVMRESSGLMELCGAHVLARAGEPRRQRCRAALDRVLEKADTLMAYSLAHRLRLALEDDPARRSALERARDAVEWRSAAANALFDPETQDGRAAMDEYLALLLAPGATELGVMRDLLESRGIGLEPPPDWKSPRSIDPRGPSTAG